jgi:hypothetical protein
VKKLVLGAVAGLVLLLLFGGCGETVVDSTKTADTIKSTLEKSEGLKIKSVDCPSDVEVKAGSTFTCTVVEKGGQSQIATLKIRNSDADLSLVSLEPPKKGG